MLFFVIFRGSFGHFYAFSVFSMDLCAQFKFELQLLIANVLDRTPVCKVGAGFVHLLNTNGSFG